MTLQWIICIILSIPSSVSSGSCHVCSSIADPGCGLTLEKSYETQCVSGHLGCKKTVRIYNNYYGNLVVRSCYNNTYANHTVVQGSPYYRDECSSVFDGRYTTCFCTGNLCNGGKSQHMIGRLLHVMMAVIPSFVYVVVNFLTSV